MSHASLKIHRAQLVQRLESSRQLQSVIEIISWTIFRFTRNFVVIIGTVPLLSIYCLMQTVVCLMEKTMPVEVNTHPTIISRRLNINSSAAASHIQQTAQPIETAHELKARTVL